MRVPFGSPILDAAARLMTPFILLFAVYVIVHGAGSPGGGFQGGVILAAALILVRLVRGTEVTWGLGRNGALGLASAGLVVYAGIGLLSLAFGGNYLDYGVLPLPMDPAHVREAGSFGIEVGVALGVTGVMVLIFDALIAWEQED